MTVDHKDLEELHNTLKNSLVVSPAEFQALQSQVTALRSDIKEIVEAWRGASFVVAFIKWAAALMAAVAVLWASLTHTDFWTKGS